MVKTWLLPLIALATVCTTRADVCDQLITHYYTQFNAASTHASTSARMEANLLQAKARYVMNLNNEEGFGQVLREQLEALQGTRAPGPGALVPEVFSYVNQLLAGSAGPQALSWLDNQIFVGVPTEAIFGVLEAPIRKPPMQSATNELSGLLGSMNLT